jgi:hypothetical protein
VASIPRAAETSYSLAGLSDTIVKTMIKEINKAREKLAQQRATKGMQQAAAQSGQGSGG